MRVPSAASSPRSPNSSPRGPVETDIQNLDLALIGNSTIAALIDRDACVVWGCFPRFDGDALFCELLRPRGKEDDFGFFAIDLTDYERSEQRYDPDTAIVVT